VTKTQLENTKEILLMLNLEDRRENNPAADA